MNKRKVSSVNTFLFKSSSLLLKMLREEDNTAYGLQLELEVPWNGFVSLPGNPYSQSSDKQEQTHAMTSCVYTEEKQFFLPFIFFQNNKVLWKCINKF